MAGNHTIVGTMTANKIAVTDTVVVANLNADQVDGADKDIDGTLAGNSDASVPTEKAVKTYVDAHKNATAVGTHGSQSAATGGESKLIHRDAAGRAQVVAPSAAADIARKDTGVLETGAGAATLKPKIIEIGDWNMNSTTFVTVAHGLGANWAKIRSLEAIIRDDDDTQRWHFNSFSLAADAVNEQHLYASSTTIRLQQAASSGYRNTNFDAITYNRGWIMIWYEE